MFNVTLRTITDILPIEGADAIVEAKINDTNYSFVIRKGQFEVGEKVIYFPLDSVMPEWIIEVLELNGMLASGNRVRTKRLRGVSSQGILAKPEKLNITELLEDFDYAEQLGIVKYEQPISYGSKSLGGLPSDMSTYDIENAENAQYFYQMLLDQFVYITEKVEGSHIAIRYEKGNITVTSRRMTIDISEDSWWTRIYNKYPWTQWFESLSNGEDNVYVIRGEIIGNGVQHNIYKLPDLQFLAFDIEIDGKPVDSHLFYYLCNELDIPTVPLLFKRGTLRSFILEQGDLKDISGKSLVSSAPKFREGIVIKPENEMLDNRGNRVFIKQRDPKYLDWWDSKG